MSNYMNDCPEPTLTCSEVVEGPMLNKQTITHAKALESAQAFISEHFENPNDRKVRVSVPVQASDDDVLLTEYIRQREADSEWRERRVQELEEALAKHSLSPALSSTQPDTGSEKK